MTPPVTEAARMPPPLARADVDWPRLYREGLRVRVGPGEGPEASGFVVPFTGEQDLLVLLIPCRRGVTGSGRALLLQAAGLARHGFDLWKRLQALGRLA